MLKFLLKILIPFNSPRYLFPIAGVVCILAIGVGLFWSVQILLSNYLDSLIEKAIESKEEYAVIKNPDKKYMSEEEEEAEFFGTQKNDFSDRMRISVSAFQKISQELSHLQDIICKPVVRQSDFIFFDQDREIKYQCCLIGYDMDEGRNAFPVLDKVSEAIRQQYIEASAGDIAPALISKELVADVKIGEIRHFRIGQECFSLKIIGFLDQNQLFAIPMMMIPTRSAFKLTKSDKYSIVAIRDFNQENPSAVRARISSLIGDGYIVKHWSELLEPLNNLFLSINIIISSILSSLFIIAFFFLLALYDIILKQHRKHLALLLSLGMPPNTIRNALFIFAVILSMLGILLGGTFAVSILYILPITPLQPVLQTMFIDDLSFSWNMKIVFLITITSLVITMGSAWFSFLRVKKIDPIEDLRK